MTDWRRVAALLRELADELEAAESSPPPRRPRRPRGDPRSVRLTAEDHARANAALRRAGIDPDTV